MASIVNGQTSTDSVTITRKAQRSCIKWYYDSKFKDSVIVYKDSIILTQSQFIELSDQRIHRMNDEINEAREESVKDRKRLKRTRIIAWGAGILAGVLTLSLFI